MYNHGRMHFPTCVFQTLLESLSWSSDLIAHSTSTKVRKNARLAIAATCDSMHLNVGISLSQCSLYFLFVMGWQIKTMLLKPSGEEQDPPKTFCCLRQSSSKCHLPLSKCAVAKPSAVFEHGKQSIPPASLPMPGSNDHNNNQENNRPRGTVFVIYKNLLPEVVASLCLSCLFLIQASFGHSSLHWHHLHHLVCVGGGGTVCVHSHQDTPNIS